MTALGIFTLVAAVAAIVSFGTNVRTILAWVKPASQVGTFSISNNGGRDLSIAVEEGVGRGMWAVATAVMERKSPGHIVKCRGRLENTKDMTDPLYAGSNQDGPFISSSISLHDTDGLGDDDEGVRTGLGDNVQSSEFDFMFDITDYDSADSKINYNFSVSCDGVVSNTIQIPSELRIKGVEK